MTLDRQVVEQQVLRCLRERRVATLIKLIHAHEWIETSGVVMNPNEAPTPILIALVSNGMPGAIFHLKYRPQDQLVEAAHRAIKARDVSALSVLIAAQINTSPLSSHLPGVLAADDISFSMTSMLLDSGMKVAGIDDKSIPYGGIARIILGKYNQAISAKTQALDNAPMVYAGQAIARLKKAGFPIEIGSPMKYLAGTEKEDRKAAIAIMRMMISAEVEIPSDYIETLQANRFGPDDIAQITSSIMRRHSAKAPGLTEARDAEGEKNAEETISRAGRTGRDMVV